MDSMGVGQGGANWCSEGLYSSQKLGVQSTMIRSTGIKRFLFFTGALIVYLGLFYHQHRPSGIRILSPLELARTKRILEIVEMNTTSLVLPDEATTLMEPSISYQCQDNGALQYMLLMFISAPENHETRNTIRSMLKEHLPKWDADIVSKNPSFNRNESIKALFFVGMPSNGATDLETLKNEGETYKDLIIDDFKEAYLNLTVKTLRMLKWVQTNCPDVLYTVKVDDDVFINVPVILKLLNRYDSNTGQDLIAGHKYPAIGIDGDPNSKWFTPKSIWDKKLPNFVAGFCYILGSRVRSNLYENALHTKLFHLEDVFLTGIVREKLLDIDVVDFPVYVNWAFSNSLLPACKIGREIAVIHQFSPEKSKCYMQFTEPNINCVLPYLLPIAAFC